MTDIAKAIQQQTNELATLVKAQQETTTGAGGSLKSLGKTSEELVFLLRGCGQYTVQVGNEEYGAPLAQALLAAQAGSSTKLRSAGFRQKVTSRLAIGIAGPYWGTQEKYARMPSVLQILCPAPTRSWTSSPSRVEQASRQMSRGQPHPLVMRTGSTE